jgi:ubiquitin-protein ligase E3 C
MMLIAGPGHSLNWYRFIGRILGNAMYEGILVDVAFAGFFLAEVCLLDL